jgi:hypothetical protein
LRRATDGSGNRCDSCHTPQFPALIKRAHRSNKTSRNVRLRGSCRSGQAWVQVPTVHLCTLVG